MRDRVIQGSGPTDRQEINALRNKLRCERPLRLEAESELARSDDHSDALRLQWRRMGRQVALWGSACAGPNANPASEAPARPISGGVRRSKRLR